MMIEMIQIAKVSDIPAIQEIASVVFPATYRDIISPEQIDFMMDMMYSDLSLTRQITTSNVAFLFCEGKGYAAYSNMGNAGGVNLFHLDKLYVMPHEQGRGYGRMLFEAVVDAARKISIGPGRIELNVNRHNVKAISFYEHIGMRKDREGDFPIGKGFFMNDYIMALDL